MNEQNTVILQSCISNSEIFYTITKLYIKIIKSTYKSKWQRGNTYKRKLKKYKSLLCKGKQLRGKKKKVIPGRENKENKVLEIIKETTGDNSPELNEKLKFQVERLE